MSGIPWLEPSSPTSWTRRHPRTPFTESQWASRQNARSVESSPPSSAFSQRFWSSLRRTACHSISGLSIDPSPKRLRSIRNAESSVSPPEQSRKTVPVRSGEGLLGRRGLLRQIPVSFPLGILYQSPWIPPPFATTCYGLLRSTTFPACPSSRPTTSELSSHC